MRLEFRRGQVGTGPNGLEIGIHGFQASPVYADDFPAQVYIEEYDGALQIHVWDGSSEDPQTIRIAPREGVQ